ACARVKAEPPRLSKSIRQYLQSLCVAPAYRIFWLNRVRVGRLLVIDVDSQHFAERRAKVLPVTLRVALRSGVAHPDVEIAVGTELNPAAAVHVARAGEFDDRSRRLA